MGEVTKGMSQTSCSCILGSWRWEWVQGRGAIEEGGGGSAWPGVAGWALPGSLT